MTGREFHDAVKLDRRNADKIAQLLGIKERTYLYQIFKLKTIPEKYIIRAMTIGLKFPNDETIELRAKINSLLKELEAAKNENRKLRKLLEKSISE